MTADLKTLNIATSKLGLTIDSTEIETFPTEAILSFLRRIADLGHFVELKFWFVLYDEYMEIPGVVIHELIRASLANYNLKVLDLGTEGRFMNYDPYLRTLFEGLKGHEGLCTFKVDVYDESFGLDLSDLRQFLSKNRKITVTNEDGEIYSDGLLVDELYSLNRFYWGSAALVGVSLSEQPSLLATALLERASGDFQRCALLLSNHVDILNEFVQYVLLDEVFVKKTILVRKRFEATIRSGEESIEPRRAARWTSRSRARETCTCRLCYKYLSHIYLYIMFTICTFSICIAPNKLSSKRTPFAFFEGNAHSVSTLYFDAGYTGTLSALGLDNG